MDALHAFAMDTQHGMYFILDSWGGNVGEPRPEYPAGPGAIIRRDIAFTPTDAWRLRCIYNNRGTYQGDWRPLFVDGTMDSPLYKNGNPKWFPGDWDHGVARGWSDGIVSVRRCTIRKRADGLWEEAPRHG